MGKRQPAGLRGLEVDKHDTQARVGCRLPLRIGTYDRTGNTYRDGTAPAEWLRGSERIASMKPGVTCLFRSGYTPDQISWQGILPEGAAFPAEMRERRGIHRHFVRCGAPVLRFLAAAADLRGYGGGAKPEGDPRFGRSPLPEHVE